MNRLIKGKNKRRWKQPDEGRFAAAKERAVVLDPGGLGNAEDIEIEFNDGDEMTGRGAFGGFGGQQTGMRAVWVSMPMPKPSMRLAGDR